MKTLSNKTQTKSKSKAKNNKKHQVIVYILRSIPKPIRFVLIVFAVLYMCFAICDWSKQRVAINYLKEKYNKDFIIKEGSYNWATWIEPKGYSGTAKVKDGSDDVEFRVGCISQDQSCVDYYLETSWARSEEKRIREYLGSDLHEKIKIEVSITPKNKEYDSKAQVSDFDYYIAKHGDNLIRKYLVSFYDDDGVGDLETAKKIIKKTQEYIKTRGIVVKDEFNHSLRLHYGLYGTKQGNFVCSFDFKKDDSQLETCFEKVINRRF